MNIYQKILEIMKDVQYLSKDDHVSFGKTNYRAISEEKVTGTMHDEMIKHGLVVFPIEQSWSRIGDITHVDVKYRIVNTENPKEYIDVTSCGDGADTQDKGSGKAMTYAFKYMWLRTFAIPTGEDPDKICNEEIESMRKAQAAARPSDPAQEKIGMVKAKALVARCQKMNVNVTKLLEMYKVKAAEELTEAQHMDINLKLNKQEEKGKTA